MVEYDDGYDSPGELIPVRGQAGTPYDRMILRTDGTLLARRPYGTGYILDEYRFATSETIGAPGGAAGPLDENGQLPLDQIPYEDVPLNDAQEQLLLDTQAAADAAEAAAVTALSAANNDGVLYDTLAGLTANTTAFIGQVLEDGANNGYYGRTDPNNVASAWERKVGETVPSLSAKTDWLMPIDQMLVEEVMPLAAGEYLDVTYMLAGFNRTTGEFIAKQPRLDAVEASVDVLEAQNDALVVYEDSDIVGGLIPFVVGSFSGADYILMGFKRTTGELVAKVAA